MTRSVPLYTDLWPLVVSNLSIRKGVPGEEGEWPRCGKAVRHEGFEKGHDCAEGKDCWAHAHWEASAGAHPPVPIPRHTSLCLPDGYQAAPHSWLGRLTRNHLSCTTDYPFSVFFPGCSYRLMIVCSPAELIECRLYWEEKLKLLLVQTWYYPVIDYVNGGELFTHLVQRVRFKEQEVALYSGEIVLALEHLHKVMSTPALIKLTFSFFCNMFDIISFCSLGLSIGT